MWNVVIVYEFLSYGQKCILWDQWPWTLTTKIKTRSSLSPSGRLLQIWINSLQEWEGRTSRKHYASSHGYHRNLCELCPQKAWKIKRWKITTTERTRLANESRMLSPTSEWSLGSWGGSWLPSSMFIGTLRRDLGGSLDGWDFHVREKEKKEMSTRP